MTKGRIQFGLQFKRNRKTFMEELIHVSETFFLHCVKE